MTKHIVSFSTGMSSALCVDRVIKRYGKEDTVVVFMDTLVEDEDNYRFMNECESYWDIKIVKLGINKTPLEISEKKKIIANSRMAPCTEELKIKPFRKFIKSINDNVIIYIGYDIEEVHRCEATTKAYLELGYGIDYPLLWKPYPNKPYSNEIKTWGIEPPRTYAMGFSHANCLKQGCVKMGAGEWVRFYIMFPERFAITEEWEQKQRELLGDYSILKDRRGGKTTSLPLKELRTQYENGTLSKKLMTQVSCINCGIGLF